MREKTKKILIVIGFIIITIIMAFGIWFLFFRQEGEGVVPEFISNIGGKISNRPSGGSTKPGKDTGKDITVEPDDGNDNQGGNNQGGKQTGDITPDDIVDIISGTDNGRDIANIISGNGSGGLTNNVDTPGKVSEIANGGNTNSNIVNNNNIKDAVVSGNTIIGYNPNDGGIYKYDPDTGRTEQVTDKKFKGAEDVTFSNNGDKAVIEFPDGSNVVYDFEKDKQYTLPASWHDFSFQKDGNKIAFMIDNEDFDKRWLAVSNPDGSSVIGIEPLGNNADKVTVSYSPNEQMIAFSRTGNAIGGLNQSVLLIGLNGENFDDIKVHGRGFHPKWSPKGTYVLYDAYNESTNYNPNLWLLKVSSASVGNQINLGLQTWVKKCTFDSKETYLYCAVPKQKLPDGTVIFTDQIYGYGCYDKIYKINLSTGFSQILAIPSTNATIDTIYVTDDNSLLYYTDKNTGIMYSMKLK